MQLSRLLSLGLTVAGSVAAGRVLSRRQRWEQEHRRVAICVDYDDAQDAAIRAGLSFDDMLQRLADHGATHVSLPELTLDRLLTLGRLTPQTPAKPIERAAPVGHWNYLHGASTLVQYLAEELQARLSYTQATVLGQETLAFAGNRPAIGEIGLGFERSAAENIRSHGLGVVPRPVSYAWPEKALLERSLAQASQLGRLVAFAGDMILGHEMHLDETLEAMTRHDLSLVYFAESRHQKGDWFIAKRRAPHVVLGHRFSPQEMIPLDYHAAAHNWANLARERGIRFCYVNFFRVLHATEPLEGLHYIEHVKAALEATGFDVCADVALPSPVPEPTPAETALVALAPAGIAAGAASRVLALPEFVSLPLAVAAAGGAAALPFLEQGYNQARFKRHAALQHDHEHYHDHDHVHSDHEHHHQEQDGTHTHDHADLRVLYPPSYTPKLLALAAAALAPVAALGDEPVSDLPSLVGSWLFPLGGAATLAAVTSGKEYLLRVEDYRGFGLDWLLPLAGSSLSTTEMPVRAGVLAALLGGWLLARRKGIIDPLAAVDSAHALGHTHHISAAMRAVGDIGILLGPRPARKWFGLGPLAQALRTVLMQRGYPQAAAVAGAASALGYALGLASFRRPERFLEVTIRDAASSYAAGASAGLVLQVLVGKQ